MIRKLGCVGAVLGLVLALAAADAPKTDGKDEGIGQSTRVPYQLTDTNHFLVRVRLNGKGPFNFLVDSGAPALYIGTEAATAIGLEASKDDFWTPLKSLEIEGGARLENLKARVEDPFQLVGMNALGLPGASIDGILGFTILARFRLEIDPTDDRMTWTRLDFKPADPPVPSKEDRERAPLEFQLMNALGPVAKGLALFIGKQPAEERSPRGFLGLEWTEPEAGGLEIVRALPGSPADRAGAKPGDRLKRINDEAVKDAETARAALAEVRPGDSVELTVENKSGESRTLTFSAGEGL